MINIECKITIAADKVSCDVDKIINEIKKNTVKVEYASAVTTPYAYSDKLPVKDETVFSKAESAGVYLIMNDKKEILYVGKSLKIQLRLKHHLQKCSETTHSQIQNVVEYLNTNNTKEIYFATIEVKPLEFYGTIEGMLIKHMKDCKDEFPKFWNNRID